MKYLQYVKCLLMILQYYNTTINQWDHQWKILFNPDSNKQAREV